MPPQLFTLPETEDRNTVARRRPPQDGSARSASAGHENRTRVRCCAQTQWRSLPLAARSGRAGRRDTGLGAAGRRLLPMKTLYTGKFLKLLDRQGWEYVDRPASKGVVQIVATYKGSILVVE